MKRILVLTDFSKRAEHAAQFAVEIAAKVNGEIILYNAFYAPQLVSLESGVYPYYEDLPAIEHEGHAEMEKLVAKINQQFIETHKTQPPVIRLLNEPGKLGENVRHITMKENIWLTVMGDKSKEPAASRFIFGSNSNAVIDNATCPVLLVPEKAPIGQIRKMIFATELEHSEHSALLFLEKLAELWQSEITVLHVCESKLSLEEKASHYNDYKKILSGIQYPHISYVDVRGDDVTSTISTYAGREKIDIIAIVHKKRSFLSDLVHRSISKKMTNYHKVPVLILHKS